MSQNNSDGFIQDFQQKINELGMLRERLQQNTLEKNAFVGQLSQYLGDIRERLNRLAEKTAEIRTQMEGMRSQIMNNESGVQGYNNEIQRLTQENEQLKNETRMLESLQQQTQQQQQQIQQEIEQSKEEIRRLTEENQTLNADKQQLESQINVLNEQIRGHPTEEENARKLQEALEEQRQVLNQQLQQIRAQSEQQEQQIRTNEQQIQQLQTQNQEKEMAIAQLIQERDAAVAQVQGHGETIGTNQQQITQLTQEIQQLSQENAQMRELIINATRIINESNISINELLNNPDFKNSSEGINKLIQEINIIIQNIEGSLNGGVPSSQPQMMTLNQQTQGQSSMLPSAERLDANIGSRPAKVNSTIVINNNEYRLDNLIQKLKSAASSPGKLKPSNYYIELANTLSNAIQKRSSILDVRDYLKKIASESNSIFNNFRPPGYEISGGRKRTRKIKQNKQVKRTTKKNKQNKTSKKNKQNKTKKLRVYNGGFIYGATAKRPSQASFKSRALSLPKKSFTLTKKNKKQYTK